MRSATVWMVRTLLMAALAAPALFLATATPSQAQPGPKEERREERNYWRHHDGRWSHWDARDKRWYYTDGQHWYYHNGNAWDLYRFDKTFGREGFEHGKYVVPTAPGTPVVVPKHQVYAVPR